MPKFVWSPKATNNPVFAVAEAGGKIRSERARRRLPMGRPGQHGRRRSRPTCSTPPSPPAATAWASPATTRPCCCRSSTEPSTPGIPVITWDSDSDQSKRLSFYSIDGDAAAHAGADVFAEAMAGNASKTYVMLSGNAGAPNLEGRITAVRAGPRRAHGLEELPTLFCNDDAVLGATLIEDQLTATPDLGGIFMIGGWPLFGDVNADAAVPCRHGGRHAQGCRLGHPLDAAPAARERHRPGPHRPEVLRLGL